MLAFVPGKTYRRREIHQAVGGQMQGGISTPSKHPVVLLFTGEQGTLYGYEDGFRPNGTFWYTGEGQVGDMQMVRGNAAICYHQRSVKALHLFEYVGRGTVQYVGQASYLAHHDEVAPDRNNDPRRVIVFELAVDTPSIGVPDLTPGDAAVGTPKLWHQPMQTLRDAAFAQESPSEGASERKAKTYFRSELIKVYVLRRAEGYCEGCGAPAPFPTRKGTPYLEPHHLRRRADNGPDHPLWVIALCPNCHARVHYGADGHDYNSKLAERVANIENLAL
jgi:5-methylcytosine-specific restriction protein A